MESEHSKNKGKDQQWIEAVLSVGIQESEQQIGPEQWEECSWLFRNLAESAKEKEVVSIRRKHKMQGRQVLEEPREAGLPGMDGKERGSFLQRGE